MAHVRSSLAMLAAFAAASLGGVLAEQPDERLGCTAIAIDGAASADGSAFAGMNTDSASSDFRLTYVPARRPTEKMRPVYSLSCDYPRFVGYGRGPFYHPRRGHNETLFKPIGYIPEVESTFGYYEATEPLVNDQGLGFGESSCAAMLVNKVAGDASDTRDVPTGIFDTVSLMQVAMERCATARCAVRLMAALVEEFGFVPTPGEASPGEVLGRKAWDDAGEAYTLADATGEAWIFHVTGGVSGILRSVWVAQRVPKGHMAVIANGFTVAELPAAPTEDFLFSPKIFEAAKAAKLWDGSGRLHFTATFAPWDMTFQAPLGKTPIPMYQALRRFGLHNLTAPSQKFVFTANSRDMPTFVKPDATLTHRDVMKYFRYQYEGTEFDMTKGMLAGPFGTPFRLEGGPKSGQVPRGIAIQRTMYSTITHSGPHRQLAWFAMDTPVTSVYVPLYSRVDAVAPTYSKGHMAKFNRESAWWAFNFVSNFMNLNYITMSQQDVYPAIEAWQDQIDEQRTSVEKDGARAMAAWQTSIQESVVKSWWNMSEFLIMKYNDGRVNTPKLGTGPGYPQWYADMIGFSNDVHPIWVQPAARPSAKALANLDGYVEPMAQVPTTFDFDTSRWSFATVPAGGERADVAYLASTATTWAVSLATLLGGIAIGGAVERRRCAGRLAKVAGEGGEGAYARLA